jgi:hypothetical protein
MDKPDSDMESAPDSKPDSLLVAYHKSLREAYERGRADYRTDNPFRNYKASDSSRVKKDAE